VKTDIHPNYRPVVFQDTSSELAFLTKSTIDTSDTIDWEDGNTYPLAKVEISSASHPFYTGKQILVDTTGRVERFRKRYGQTSTKKTAPQTEASAPQTEAAASGDEAVASESQAAPAAEAPAEAPAEPEAEAASETEA
jgi:large subunit ribosomal protein L31